MILRQQILSLLKECRSYALPDGTLRDSLRLIMGEAAVDSEIDAALGWLKAKAYIDFTVEEVSETKRWVITASGREKCK